MISIKLTSSTAHDRRPCLTCGAPLDTDALVGQVFDDDQAKGCAICARCIRNPLAVLADLCERVEGYRAAAARRGESTVNFSTYPTLEDFALALVAAHDSYRQVSGRSIH